MKRGCDLRRLKPVKSAFFFRRLSPFLIVFLEHVEDYGCVQTGATTPNIVAPTMLGVVGCVLAVVRMQQLPTSLGPAVHRGKNTTHKSL